jgi:hypothetical protein
VKQKVSSKMKTSNRKKDVAAKPHRKRSKPASAGKQVIAAPDAILASNEANYEFSSSGSNQTNQTNQINQTNQKDQTNQTNKKPYNETLLDSAKAQWQDGNWEGLARMERGGLQSHPDRAKLALLAAAGHQQQGVKVALSYAYWIFSVSVVPYVTV